MEEVIRTAQSRISTRDWKICHQDGRFSHYRIEFYVSDNFPGEALDNPEIFNNIEFHNMLRNEGFDMMGIELNTNRYYSNPEYPPGWFCITLDLTPK